MMHLDALSDRLNHRLPLRDRGDHLAMVTNHTVDVRPEDGAGVGRAGVRWYELRRPDGGSWTVHQQGTYAPDDGENRWMGSMAMAGNGSIGLIYTVSSDNTYPSIRYTGRRPDDQLGQMTIEEESVRSGSRSHTGKAQVEFRWGDYASLAVDPTDGTTFWGTHEYGRSGEPDPGWDTRIFSFDVPAPPLNVNLIGPSYLNSGEEGTWTASVSGGLGTPSYDWEYQPACPDSRKSPNRYCGWSPKNCSGPDCSHTFFNNTDETMDGGIRVTVTKGTQTATDSKTVTVSPSGGSSSTTASGGSFGTPAQRHSPVLRDLDAQSPSKEAVTLTWRALGSPLPARFVVEHRADTTGAWSQVGTVAASDSAGAAPAGTVAYRYRAEDLAPGTHQFRLALAPDRKAGARRASEAVTVRADLDAAYRLSTYPNPVRERATVELAVREQQEVTVAVYDVLGRRVTTLHAGPLPAEELRRLRLDAPATGLTSGQYFLRVTGEQFAATRRMTVVR